MVKHAIRKIALPIGQILFFPVFVILAAGAALSLTPPGVQRLLGSLPMLESLWKSVAETLFSSASSIVSYIVRAAAFLYLVPFAAFLLVSLVILLVYHPKAPQFTDDHRQNAETMWTLARHAQMNARLKEKDISGKLAVLTGIIAAVGVVGIFVCWLVVPGYGDLLSGLAITEHLKLFVLSLILIFSYGILNFPLTWVMKPVHSCHIPKRMVESAEVYCRSLRRVPADATPNTDSIEEIAAPAPEIQTASELESDSELSSEVTDIDIADSSSVE